MTQRKLFIFGGAAVLGLALIALPATWAKPQDADNATISELQRTIRELQSRLQAQAETFRMERTDLAEADALEAAARPLLDGNQDTKQRGEMPENADKEFDVFVGDGGLSWLGVETHEVTADKVKELKLPAERGVILGKIIPNSPAAKAGLKENDVVTEMNGQRVEGAAQFRRMIHEIPSGRTAQLTVWREGRAQTISVTLGKAEENRHAFRMMAPAPGAFAFRMPDLPELPEIPPMDHMFYMGQPRLGIDAEDLSGQLGNFFGAPDGEGILVREVNQDSPAERAGVKAGDVIIKFNGERIRTIGDLREKLSTKQDDKDRTVKLGVLRNKSEIALSVELPAPPARGRRASAHRISI